MNILHLMYVYSLYLLLRSTTSRTRNVKRLALVVMDTDAKVT